MTSITDQTIEALRTGHDSLVAAVASYGPDDLIRTSGASEWTVAAVLSHLGSGAEINLAVLESALDGTSGPDMDFNKSVWARWDGMSPAEQAAHFPAANEKLLSRFEGLDSAARSSLRISYSFLPAPVDVEVAAGMRLSEFALHSWDVRVAFDSAAVVAPEAVGVLLDRVGDSMGFVGKADRFSGSASLAVHTVDPERSFGLVIGDTVSLTSVVPSEVDGELSAPAEYLFRLFTGRSGAAHTPSSVSVTGVSLDSLRAVFPGY